MRLHNILPAALLLPLAASSSFQKTSLANLKLDTSSPANLQIAAQTVGQNLYSYKPQGGRFTQLAPWFWWIGGAAWDTFLSYGAYTKDTQFENQTIHFLDENTGKAFDFVQSNNGGSEASDDQALWAFAALSGLELGVDHSGIKCPADKPSCKPFFDLAHNTYTDFISRWNASTCGGGMPWGFVYNPGAPNQLTYKNTITNGGFFHLAARLARYTGQKDYADWAEKIWDWLEKTGLITEDFDVYDGASSTDNCQTIDKDEWTYLNAVLVYGAAAMADYSNGKDRKWADRAVNLTDVAIQKFTKPVDSAPGVIFEANRDCERQGKCNTDQKTFKGYLARYLGRTASLLPELKPKIVSVLNATAAGAVQTCTGGDGKTNCGSKWYTGSFNGEVSPPQDLAVFDALVALIGVDHPPLKASDVQHY